ncbi:McrC family protein [Streptomyces sp. S07_1.15]|uniref:McrC family protein n=1 Tax=Streptomyces sp. S07_1.15 TaxID=2873925 RepID=UPI001D13A5A1|nr:McrC family protein [Streptomyces sp. S07_1.15]MCC3650909.1 McrC family protein [Streptomyces sp. S07_1.15]
MTDHQTKRTTRTPLVVQEHRSLRLHRDQLTEADLHTLTLLRDNRKIGLRETREGWTLTARSTVGVLALDRVRLALSPKLDIPGNQLITWLCYAQSTPVPHEPTVRRWLIGESGYADIALSALLAECLHLLHHGLRRDYQRTDRVEPVLRGRLDVRAQATRRYGAVDQLHVQTFERDVHIWENLVCGAALSAAADLASDPALARALKDTAARFPRPTHPGDAPRMLARARYTRLNEHYGLAHTWARLVLVTDRGGVTDLLTERGLRADSMLLNMDVLWERVVRQMAHNIATEFGGRHVSSVGKLGIRTAGDMSKTEKSFTPDVLLCFPASQPRFLPIDAKYKTYAKKTVSSEDRHQLLTYIAGYAMPGAPLAAIVHPGPQGATRRTLTITGPRGTLGVIKVLGLDTRLPPHQAAEPLRELMEAFSAK